MYTIHFSALETALLPYFLFVVYSAIVLWVRSVRENPSQFKPELEQSEFTLSIDEPTTDPLATEFERELIQRVMTPSPSPKTRKRQSKAMADLISTEWNKTDPVN